MSATKSKSNLPSFQELIKQGWEVLKEKWLQVIILYIIMFLGAIAVVLALGLSFFLLGSTLESTSIVSSLVIGVILALLGGVVMTIIGSVLGASIFISLADKKTDSLSAVIKKGWAVAMPFFLTGLLSGFLILGNAALVIIPGIIVGFLLIFASYAAVLSNLGPIKSLQRSLALFKEHGWELFGKLLLVGVIPAFVSTLFNSFLGEVSTSLYILYTITIHVVITFVSTAAVIQLYLKADEATPKNKESKIGIIWVSAILGVILISGLMISITNMILRDAVTYFEEASIENNLLLEQALDDSMLRDEIMYELENEFGSELDEFNAELDRLEAENPELYDAVLNEIPQEERQLFESLRN